MNKSKGYTDAVNNLEMLSKRCQDQLNGKDKSTIQYNIFLLRMQPQYIIGKELDDSNR